MELGVLSGEEPGPHSTLEEDPTENQGIHNKAFAPSRDSRVGEHPPRELASDPFKLAAASGNLRSEIVRRRDTRTNVFIVGGDHQGPNRAVGLGKLQTVAKAVIEVSPDSKRPVSKKPDDGLAFARRKIELQPTPGEHPVGNGGSKRQPHTERGSVPKNREGDIVDKRHFDYFLIGS